MELPFINKALQADSDMLLHAACMTAINPLSPPIGDYGRHMAVYNIHTGMPVTSLFYRCPHGPLLPLVLAPITRRLDAAQWPYHVALFPFSVAAVVGCYFLLLLLVRRTAALLASVCIALSPVFVVNSHNIMWDVPVFAFMVWSLALLLHGSRKKSIPFIIISGVCAGLAAITKMSAFPLLLCSALFLISLRDRRLIIAWLLPAASLPLAWAAHNISTYGTIQYLSTNCMDFLPGDMRYKLERFAIFIGGLAVFPLSWWWIIVRLRHRENRLFIIVALTIGLVWLAGLFVALHFSIGYAMTCVFFGIAGIWAGLSAANLLLCSQKLIIAKKERVLLCGFFLMYGCFLLMLPTAEPRFILPILPFFVMLLALSTESLGAREKRIFIPMLLLGQTLLSLALARADALVADSDRRLPGILKARGYGPGNTGYYGRLQFDYYLWKAGYPMIGIDSFPIDSLRYAVESRIPSDLPVRSVLPKNVSITLVDTFAVSYFPLRVCPPGCGLYGEARLPYRFDTSLPLKSYNVYAIHKEEGFQ